MVFRFVIIFIQNSVFIKLFLDLIDGFDHIHSLIHFNFIIHLIIYVEILVPLILIFSPLGSFFLHLQGFSFPISIPFLPSFHLPSPFILVILLHLFIIFFLLVLILHCKIINYIINLTLINLDWKIGSLFQVFLDFWTSIFPWTFIFGVLWLRMLIWFRDFIIPFCNLWVVERL